jgi:NDP-sugar pyrophosphorylase family protein
MRHKISEPPNPNEIDAVVLCGGLGTRLKKVVSDRPKPMADINGRPFLELLLGSIAKFGFRRFVLCAGYMADSITDFFASKRLPFEVVVSRESRPLGTGGALRNAARLIRSDPFLVANGDSLCAVDLNEFLKFHVLKQAVISMCVAKTRKSMEYGAVKLGPDSRILSFSEKAKVTGPVCCNAGIYVFGRKALSLIPAGKTYSLEHELFPALAEKALYGYLSNADILDIGTPRRYEKARRLLKKRL